MDDGEPDRVFRRCNAAARAEGRARASGAGSCVPELLMMEGGQLIMTPERQQIGAIGVSGAIGEQDGALREGSGGRGKERPQVGNPPPYSATESWPVGIFAVHTSSS